MKLIELILDDEEAIGVEAISVVENPAIESDFIALNNQEIKLAEINKEKRLLMGALLIPKKPIYRKSGEDEYYIFFSEKTVENDEIWNDYVKTGKVKGFSIEGYFADKMERPNEELKEDLEEKQLAELKKLLS